MLKPDSDYAYDMCLSLQLPLSHMKRLVAMDCASIIKPRNAMESTIVATGWTKETVQVCKTEPTLKYYFVNCKSDPYGLLD